MYYSDQSRFILSGKLHSVHSVDVCLVEELERFPLEFEGRRHQPSVRGPQLLAHRHGARQLELLQLQ